MNPPTPHRLSLASTGLAILSFLILPCAVAAQPDGKPQKLSSPDQVPEGLAKSDWSSIRAAYEAGRHAFQPIEGGWQARNPGQQWTTRFDGRGFLAQPRDGGWQWGLELKSYGFGEKQIAISGTPAVKAAGLRLSYQWDATVQEWWVNDQRGLEHGFTLAQRPDLPVPSSPPLAFTLATRGTLKPKVTEDAQGVLFQDAAGATVLNYSGLKVWDADGKTLPSRFEAAGENQVRLLVSERGARYPITIDPIAQQAFLKAGNNGPPSEDSFGRSVAVAGDTVVVGAPGEDSSATGVNGTPDDSARNAGAAYIFVRNQTNWSQQAYLKASNAGVDDSFGTSVAIAGDTVIVAANGEDSNTTGVNSTPNNSAKDSGAVYVFVRIGTNWSQQAYLKASNTGVDDLFGNAVAVSGDTVVVGAIYEDSSTTGVNSTSNNSASESGAAYVFFRNGTNWTEQAYLKPAAVGTSQSGDLFGYSVSVSGDTVVVGAILEDGSATGTNNTPNDGRGDSGAAYVFIRSGSNWSQQAYIKASNTGGDDNFGRSVAVSGHTVIVGANGEDSSSTGVNSSPNEGAFGSGAAYVFVRSGTIWSQQAYLKPSAVGTTQDYDSFGSSVAISGDTVVVGAPGEFSSTTGINSTPNEAAFDAGAAYVFVRSGTIWSQQAYLKASNTAGSDVFAYSVGVSGDIVIAGALGEDSSTTGVNSTPNEGASSAGAAYVYMRTGTNWSQESYLKSNNTPVGSGVSDYFGNSVAVSGDTVVVGAYGEDSGSSGVNSTPDEGAERSGAAYVFVRSGAVWSQQAYLKASNTGESDEFGRSVAVSGDTLVVGAPLEDSSTTGVNSISNNGASNSGAAYVFVRSGTSWSQQAYLKPASVGASQESDFFGSSVAISGDTVIVGTPGEDSSSTGVNSASNESALSSGAAYVFIRDGTSWNQQAYLKPAAVGTSQSGDNFGTSVAVSDHTVVIGAAFEDSSTTGINSTPNESASGAGAVYVFVRSGTNWSQQAYIKPAIVGASQESDFFGVSVAVSGNTVVAGAMNEDSGTTGINSAPNESALSSGSAYVFVREGTSWVQQAYLKASNTGANDLFGYSVAVEADTVVVGAYGEDSSTNGINSTSNNSASDAGAAYVFVRSAGVWSQQAYLKASQVNGDDQFGCSVAVSGDTVVAGARYEESGTTGVNSTPDELAPNAGAAYIFTGLPPLPAMLFQSAMTAAGLSGADAALEAIPHNDGVENLLKYAFNMNLSGPDAVTMPPGGSSGLPGIAAQPNGTASIFRYEFLRRRNSGLIYTPQKSPDISNPALWTNLTDVPTVISIDAVWERVVYDEPYNAATTPKCFGRVQVTLP